MGHERAKFVVEYAIEAYPELNPLAKLLSVTSSDFCSVDAHTVMYVWDYSQFSALEKYVAFCEDRQYWYDEGAAYEEKIKNNSR